MAEWMLDLVEGCQLHPRSLIGVVLLNQRRDSGIDVSQRHTGIRPGDSQMGRPLNLFPVGFQFVLVSKFLKQGV